MAPKDIYDRRPTSTSRGRTIQRIMDLQHAQGVIPGTETVLDSRPEGSIAAALMAFHATWVEPKAVTTRRAYERSLAFFARDLAANGPAPSSALGDLRRERLVAHLDWRLTSGLHDPGEAMACERVANAAGRRWEVRAWTTFGAASLLLPLTTGVLWQMPRFALLVPPVFWMLGALGTRHAWLHRAVLVLFPLALVVKVATAVVGVEG